MSCFADSIAARERVGDRHGIGICLNNLARAQFFRGDLASCRVSTEKALSLFESLGDKKGVLIAQCNLGEALTLEGRFDEAKKILERCAAETRLLKIQRLLESTQCNLAAVELELGEESAARLLIEELLRSLPVDPPLELRAQALYLRATLHLREHRIEESRDAVRESASILKELRLLEKLGVIGSLQARLLTEEGDPEESLHRARTLLVENEKLMDQIGKALLHKEMGRAYREMGPDWADKTETELLTAMTMFEKMGSPHNAASARAELGLYWRLVGEELLAQEHWHAAEEALQITGARSRLQELARLRT
jgi:tetratricopeptide (TPR) repeat protein